MCECYKIGGPFIAEDPNCPVHGWAAVQEREERESREHSLIERVEQLEEQISEIQALLNLR